MFGNQAWLKSLARVTGVVHSDSSSSSLAVIYFHNRIIAAGGGQGNCRSLPKELSLHWKPKLSEN